jgi:hypothetical protein
MPALIIILLGLAIDVVLIFYRALFAKLFYAWFFVTSGFQPLPLAVFIGAGFLISLCKGSPPDNDEDENIIVKFLMIIAWGLAFPPIILIIAAICRAFLF